MNTQRVSVVKLGLDRERRLWLQEATGQPIRLDGDFRETLLQDNLPGAEKIAVLALPENVELIHFLCELRRETGRPGYIVLGPPSARSSPDSSLGPLMTGCLAPSLGGWRDLSAADEITYALASAMQSNRGLVSVDMIEMAMRHPAWPALSFPSHFCSTSAVYLITALLDPRWYVDPAKPNSNKRLATHFGVGAAAERRFHELITPEGGGPITRRTKLAHALWSTWGSGREESPPQDTSEPRDFLWRLCYASGLGLKGPIKACRVFLSMVRDVWLDNLTPPRRYELVTSTLGRKKEQVRYVALQPADSRGTTRQLFVPRHFFSSDAEIGEWEKHVREWRRRAETAV